MYTDNSREFRLTFKNRGFKEGVTFSCAVTSVVNFGARSLNSFFTICKINVAAEQTPRQVVYTQMMLARVKRISSELNH